MACRCSGRLDATRSHGACTERFASSGPGATMSSAAIGGAMSTDVLVVAADSANEVLAAGRRLRSALAERERAEYVSEQLAEKIERGLDRMSAQTEQRYDDDGVPQPVTPEEALAAAASQLHLADLAIAAGEALES